MRQKSYIVALRSDKMNDVSPQWADQLHGIAGVEVQGASAEQARIKADDVGIRTLRAKLNANFLIEEESLRSL
jgi:hypothetical protein